MTDLEFETTLRQTLADHQLSRKERRSLADALGGAAIDAQKLGVYRHKAFEIALAEINDAGAQRALAWLEEVNKLLLPADDEPPVCQAYFSPGGACRGRIIELIGSAREAIDLCVFTITDDRIRDAILAARQRKVPIRIITDRQKCLDEGSDTQTLARAGIDVRLSRDEGHMHHKFGIFDCKWVLTGSYNWTRSAGSVNRENIVVSNDRRLVKMFENEFERLWRDGA